MSAPAHPRTSTSTSTLGVTRFGPGLFAVASSDPSHGPYRVEQHGATYTCSCPAFTYARTGDGTIRTCKHAAAVRAFVAAEQEHQPAPVARWCELCLMSPVTDGFSICATCASAEATRAVAAIDEYYAAGATRTVLAGDEDDVYGPPSVAWDLGAEYDRVARTNARVDALFGWDE